MQPKMIWEPEIKSGKCSFLLVVEQVARELIPPLLPKSELKNIFHSFTHFSVTKLCYLNKQYDPNCSNQISIQCITSHLCSTRCPWLSRFLSLPFPPLPSPYHRDSPGFKVQHTITSGIGDRLDCKRCRQENQSSVIIRYPGLSFSSLQEFSTLHFVFLISWAFPSPSCMEPAISWR